MTIAPNAFQVPNIYVDRAMELLSDSEFRVLLFATRHIMGWQGNIDERQSRISLSVFEFGFTTRNGYTCASCGLGRGSIIKALAKLVEFKFLEKVGDPTEKGQQWKLMDNGIDWDALLERKNKNDASRKKQTAKATQAGIVKRTSSLDAPPTGTLDVTMQGIVERTTPSTLDVPIQSHGESHLKSHEEKEEVVSAADAAEQYVDQHMKKLETGEMQIVSSKKYNLMDAVCIAFKIKAGGHAQILIKQLTGDKSSKGKRLEFLVDDPPMTELEILAFRDWYGTHPRYKDQDSLPQTAETLYERALEFRAQRDYQHYIDVIVNLRNQESKSIKEETRAELPPPDPEQAAILEDVLNKLARGEKI